MGAWIDVTITAACTIYKGFPPSTISKSACLCTLSEGAPISRTISEGVPTNTFYQGPKHYSNHPSSNKAIYQDTT